MSSKYMLQKSIISQNTKRIYFQATTNSPLKLLRYQSRNYHAFSSFYSFKSNDTRKLDRFTTNNVITSFSSSTTTIKTPSDNENPLAETKSKPIEEEQLEFQAETRQLLDIVTHSLYTDKQIFLRELISNASDALEKLRHIQSANEGTILDPSIPLEIRIETNEADKTLTISDTGVGMTKNEMIENLGTIARSGSKAFVKRLAEMKGDVDAETRGIIGKFGVGFYSAFMVGDKIEVRSKYSLASQEEDAKVWTSSGGNTFSISTLDSDQSNQTRGTSIVVHVNESQLEFIQEARIEEIIKKYSNFVNFPIYLNGKRINTIQALWAENPQSISNQAYNEFYKFVSNAREDFMYKLHLMFDAPVDIKALLFVPLNHTEKFGMGRMHPGVALYSRKILIESKPEDILPPWLRFLKGVIDSEDLPVSISREKAQDSALIGKIRKALTRRFLNFMSNKAKKEPDDFKTTFYPEYGYFLKEGVASDEEFQENIAKLLHWETSKTLNKELSSFDEYLSRAPPEQKEIYYLCTASREIGFQSPYYEAFEKAGREVIFVYSGIDEFTLHQLDEYEGRKIVSIEKSNIDLGKKNDEDDTKKDESRDASGMLTKTEQKEFATWFQTLFPGKIESVKPTSRLSTSPAMITNHESGAMRRMMKIVDAQDVNYTSEPLPELELEFNPDHEIIIRMFRMRKSDPVFAKVCAEQVWDNCLVAAGLMDDSRTMLRRLNDILLLVVKGRDDASVSKVDKIEEDASKVKPETVLEAELVEKDLEKEDEIKDLPDLTQNETDELINDLKERIDVGKKELAEIIKMTKLKEKSEKLAVKKGIIEMKDDPDGTKTLTEAIRLLNEEESDTSDSDSDNPDYYDTSPPPKKKGKKQRKPLAADKVHEDFTPSTPYRFQKNKLHRKPRKSVNDDYVRVPKNPNIFDEMEKDQNRYESRDFVKNTRKQMDEELGETELRNRQRAMADSWLRNEMGYDYEGGKFDKRDIWGFDGDTTDRKKKVGNKKKRRSHKRRK